MYAHREDALLLEKGVSGRPVTSTPDITNRVIYQMFIKSAGNSVPPVAMEEKIRDSDLIPVAGGLQVINAGKKLPQRAHAACM